MKRLLIVLLIVIMVFMMSITTVSASCETKNDTMYIVSGVMADLQNSKVCGVDFDLEDYPKDQDGSPAVIAFSEYGYSATDTTQKDYALYVYVYNPSESVIDDSAQNKIVFEFGSTIYTYAISIVDYSLNREYKYRFYKLKVNINQSDRASFIPSLGSSTRTYTISKVDLVVGRELTIVTVGQAYTFSGYMKGFGSDTDPLTCTIDKTERSLSLNVHQTVYRAQGDYYHGEQSQLNSCFFTIPKKYFDYYGELTAILAEWYEYVTKPILVSELSDIVGVVNNWNKFNSTSSDFLICALDNEFMGQAMATTVGWTYYPALPLYYVSNTSLSTEAIITLQKYPWWDSRRSEYVYFATESWDSYDRVAAAFYTGDGVKYDEASVSSDSLKAAFLANTTADSTKILDKYSIDLFIDSDDSVDSGHTRGYNRVEFDSTSVTETFWNETTKNFWQRLFGGYSVETHYNTLPVLYEVKSSDLEGLDEAVANRLYVSVFDVPELRRQFAATLLSGNHLVLFRYGNSTYKCSPVTQSFEVHSDDTSESLLVKHLEQLKNMNDSMNNCHGYIAQETVYLDFDIISLTFTDNDVETTVFNVMTPQDVFSELTPPLKEDYHTDKPDWKRIIAILLLILLIVILFPVIKFIIKVVAAPVKFSSKQVKKSRNRKQRDKGGG